MYIDVVVSNVVVF